MASPRRSVGAMLAGLTLGVALVILAIVLTLGGGSPYQIRAEFENTGRVVKGGQVRVAGRTVGSIADIRLTDDGLVALTLSIDDDHLVPLHEGTTAQIRAVGAATLTNNFVELVPGAPDGRSLPDNAMLPLERTRGIVDLDAILSSFGPRQRADLRNLFANTADAFAGSGARTFNAMLAKLSPALAEVGALTEEVSSDRADLRGLIATASQTASAIASRRPDLGNAVDHTATALMALDAERAALDDTLQRGASAMRRIRPLFTQAKSALADARPTLKLIPPVARRATPFLRRLTPLLDRLKPNAERLTEQAPDLRRAFDGFSDLRSQAVNALSTLGEVARTARPILRGLRYYAPDIGIGVFNGFLSLAGGNYNGFGHYFHASFVAQPQYLTGGLLADLFYKNPTLPGTLELRSPLTNMCPGGAAPPAPDRSNVVVPPDTISCTPAQGIPADVNHP